MTQEDTAAITEVAKEMLVTSNEAEETPPNSEPEAAANDSQETATDEFNFDIEVPEDLLEELEIPDEEDEETEEEYEDEYEDPDSLKRKLAAERKKVEYLEKQKVEKGRKEWAKEAAKFFPLSEPYLEKITATSRRSFIREAKAKHEELKPLFEKFSEKNKIILEAEKAKAIEEARAIAEKAWGKPTSGPDVPPSNAEISVEEEKALINKGGLFEVTKEMIKRGVV
jgi:hypothetical protein